MTTPSPARNVRIDAQPGYARILLDDLDVGEYVLGYSLQHDIHGGLPQVVLHTRQPAGTTFQGLAHVAVADEQTAGETVARFLEGVDPAALERAALTRDDLGHDKGAVTRAILAQLADWARERGGN